MCSRSKRKSASGEAPDGEDPARILSQRTAEGDSARAGNEVRKAATSFRSCRENPQDAPVEGCQTRANAELKKLKAMARCRPKRPLRAIIWTCCCRPWGQEVKLKKDIVEAQAGSTRIIMALKGQGRIVEYLAVQTRTNKLKGPILCMVGTPGVGKTRSALDRPRHGREFAANRSAVCATRPRLAAIAGLYRSLSRQDHFQP